MSHTKRVVIYATMLATVILALGSYINGTLAASSRKLEGYINQIEQGTAAGNWQLAEEGLSLIESDWSKTKNTWAMLLDHIEIDNIDSTLSKVEKYVETREKPSALAEISTLKLYIKHIPRKESFNLGNIF